MYSKQVRLKFEFDIRREDGGDVDGEDVRKSLEQTMYNIRGCEGLLFENGMVSMEEFTTPPEIP